MYIYIYICVCIYHVPSVQRKNYMSKEMGAATCYTPIRSGPDFPKYGGELTMVITPVYSWPGGRNAQEKGPECPGNDRHDMFIPCGNSWRADLYIYIHTYKYIIFYLLLIEFLRFPRLISTQAMPFDWLPESISQRRTLRMSHLSMEWVKRQS